MKWDITRQRDGVTVRYATRRTASDDTVNLRDYGGNYIYVVPVTDDTLVLAWAKRMPHSREWIITIRALRPGEAHRHHLVGNKHAAISTMLAEVQLPAEGLKAVDRTDPVVPLVPSL